MESKALAKMALVVIGTWCWPIYSAMGNDIRPPNVEMIDEFGVNMATGQVAIKQSTVSIGGDGGLTHHIQLYGNNFGDRGYGYYDGFAGTVRTVLSSDVAGIFQTNDAAKITHLRRTATQPQTNVESRVYVYRASGVSGQHEFALYNRDTKRYETLLPQVTYDPAKHELRAVGDSRHSLEIIRGDEGSSQYQYLWTMPDGTQNRYYRGYNNGKNYEVIYPNGFMVEYRHGAAITNTGLMIKYNYAENSGTNAWLNRNPSSVVGINLADSYCSPEVGQNCASEGWPTATFQWPEGTPDVFFVPHDTSRKVFSVTDQFGGESKYFYENHNVCLYQTIDVPPTLSQMCVDTNTGPREQWSPRLVAVKSSDSAVIDREFNYKNSFRLKKYQSASSGIGINGVFTYWLLNDKAGILTRATNRDRSTAYQEPMVGGSGASLTFSGNGNSVTVSNSYPGTLSTVRWRKSGQYNFEPLRNFLTNYTPVGEPTHSYSYDDRGNMDGKTIGGKTVLSAEYPTDCIDDNNNFFFRYCNKPTWVKDAKGNRTDYTYHEHSGQIHTVTKPAVSIGSTSVRPRITYDYSPLYAYYKKNSNTVERADSPIWKLTSEFTCRTTAATSSGCAGGDLDKVETRYYYGPQNGEPNNLFLRGVSVTAAGDTGTLETRVTCYEYDRFGNQTAETRPKGNATLTSCP